MKLKSRPSFSGRALLLAALLLQGCAEPKLSPVPIDGTVLAFGDSLTLGVGADQNDSYPSVLSELGGRRGIGCWRRRYTNCWLSMAPFNRAETAGELCSARGRNTSASFDAV